MRSICYSIIMTRSDIAKLTFRVVEFLINSSSQHMRVAKHCLRYLYAIKYLSIKYLVSREEEIMTIVKKNNFIYINKQMFEITTNVSFTNYSDRKSDEDYIFRLFDKIIN
jgi:hypothetical protein